MLFNSFGFIYLFLPITFVIYFFLNKKNYTQISKVFIFFSSLFFYSWWNIIYLPLILFSLIFNFVLGRAIIKSSTNDIFSKKQLLIIGIIINIFLLSYFKYAEFFIQNFNLLLNFEIPQLKLVLPLAISFFTLQQIAYLVDVYKKKSKENSFINYGMFITFFPQLIAGPIVYHREMMKQYLATRNNFINFDNISLGLFIFSIGLFKKVVIADSFAIWVNYGFDRVDIITFFQAWVSSLSYTFQLYFDFSGYTDMALGAALLFNIKLPNNFNSPYKATNIQDFWRRWHITLSRFLRDYLYIPLGGSKKSDFKTYNNLMITFVIGGLWHGAGWTFLFWGFLHGLALIIYRIWSFIGFKLNIIISWIITFNFINIAWIFFRADELGIALKMIKKMFQFSPIEEINLLQIFLITIILIIIIFCKNTSQFKKKDFSIYRGTLIGFLFFFSLITLFLRGKGEFIYFQF